MFEVFGRIFLHYCMCYLLLQNKPSQNLVAGSNIGLLVRFCGLIGSCSPCGARWGYSCRCFSELEGPRRCLSDLDLYWLLAGAMAVFQATLPPYHGLLSRGLPCGLQWDSLTYFSHGYQYMNMNVSTAWYLKTYTWNSITSEFCWSELESQPRPKDRGETTLANVRSSLPLRWEVWLCW